MGDRRRQSFYHLSVNVVAHPSFPLSPDTYPHPYQSLYLDRILDSASLWHSNKKTNLGRWILCLNSIQDIVQSSHLRIIVFHIEYLFVGKDAQVGNIGTKK